MMYRAPVFWYLLLVLILSACSGVTSPSPEIQPQPVSTIPNTPTVFSKPSRLPAQSEVEGLLVQLVDQEQRATAIVIGMIADDPQERWAVGYGKLSETDLRTPDGNTVYEIASVSKVFTGSLLALAVQAGEVQLNDPIAKYLPPGVSAPEYKGTPISLLDLATQSSGLPRMPDNFNPEDPSNPFADYTMEQMYTFLSSYQLTRKPGMTYEYSNYGMSLLGNLLARRAGQTDYEALLVDRICKPLGMDSTRVHFTSDMQLRLAAPHNNVLYPDNNWDLPTFAGGGGIRSTANDMLTFLAANMGITETDLLPALELANEEQRGTNILNTSIGLAWNLTRTPNGIIHWHNGQTGGYHSYFGWIPEQKIGVIVLANAAINIDDVGRHLLDSSYPMQPHVPRPTPIAVDPQILVGYAGTYRLTDTVDLVVRVDGNRIFMLPTGESEVELLGRADDKFYIREADIEFTFTKDSSGKVDGLILVQDGVPNVAEKID